MELPGLPGAMDAYGKSISEFASLLLPDFPQSPTAPWKMLRGDPLRVFLSPLENRPESTL